jgi:hypothetical protein
MRRRERKRYWWGSHEKPLRRQIDGWIILKWISGWGGMDWTAMAEDRERWRALVDTVMYLRIL